MGFSLPVSASLNYTAEIFNEAGTLKIIDLKVAGFADGEVTQQTAQFSDLAGKLLVEERAVLKGVVIMKVEFDQKQTGAKGVVDFDGKVAKFKKIEAGKTETSEEMIKGDFVLTSNFQHYVKTKWKELTEGGTVSFRFGVWERLETVGFQLTKVKDEVEGGRNVIVIRMKPSSFLISMLVKPIEFKFNADGTRLLQSKGPVQPKLQDGTAWKDQNGVAIYTYP